MKYLRQEPREYEAIQNAGNALEEAQAACPDGEITVNEDRSWSVPTPEENLLNVPQGSWLVYNSSGDPRVFSAEEFIERKFFPALQPHQLAEAESNPQG